MGDTRVDGSRRSAVRWVLHEAEERTIGPVVMALLASGRVPPIHALLGRADSRPFLPSRLACLWSIWGDNAPLERTVRSLIHEWANVSA